MEQFFHKSLKGNPTPRIEKRQKIPLFLKRFPPTDCYNKEIEQYDTPCSREYVVEVCECLHPPVHYSLEHSEVLLYNGGICQKTDLSNNGYV